MACGTRLRLHHMWWPVSYSPRPTSLGAHLACVDCAGFGALCRHELFVDMVREHAAGKGAGGQQVEAQGALGRAPNRPADMPVYGVGFLSPEDP